MVIWESKKRAVVAWSSAEAEYQAVAKATTELLDELGFQISKPMTLWCDNKAAIHIATNPVFHESQTHRDRLSLCVR